VSVVATAMTIAKRITVRVIVFFLIVLRGLSVDLVSQLVEFRQSVLFIIRGQEMAVLPRDYSTASAIKAVG
jgi:hypothetical protein